MKPTDRNVYHIFTLGFCGAPERAEDESQTTNRLKKLSTIIPYLKDLHINTLLLGPLNESLTHGYNTTDYYKVDHRLGTKEDLKQVIDAYHEAGIDVLFDCVFNHVGREHFAFRDLLQNRENSRYKDWFEGVNFWGNNSYNDGFSYANWAGHDELVKLNLYNPEVRNYLLEILDYWIDTYDIDGVRLDAANVMNSDFLRELNERGKARKADFLTIGEIVGGNYDYFIRESGIDTLTNYETYKGLYSSLNDKNYFEIAHSIRRLFEKNGGLIKDVPAYNFVDNHDVERVATTLRDKKLLTPLYILLYTMPGFPTIYYGSEQALEGRKEWGSDSNLRPPKEAIDFEKDTDLYKLIARLGKLREDYPVLREGLYDELLIQPEQYAFKKSLNGEEVFILLNMNEDETALNLNLSGDFVDLLNEEKLVLSGQVSVPGNSGRILVKKGSNDG